MRFLNVWFQVWEHGAAAAARPLRQLLPDPPSQPEVRHWSRDIHGRAAEETRHRWLGEKGRDGDAAEMHRQNDDSLLFCTPPPPPPPLDDRRLAVHRPCGGPSFPLVVCYHHHPGHLGHLLRCQFQLHTWRPLSMKDKTDTPLPLQQFLSNSYQIILSTNI